MNRIALGHVGYVLRFTFCVVSLLLSPLCLAADTPATPPAAAKLPEALTPSDTGAFVLDSVVFEIYHITSTGKMFMQHQGIQRADGYPHSSDELYELKGVIPSPNGTFDIDEILRPTGPNAFKYETTLHSAAGLPTNFLALHAILPAERYAGQNVVVNGVIVALPEKVGGASQLAREAFTNKVLIATPNGIITVEGPVDLLVQDDRRYNNNTFTLRFHFTPSNGTIKDAKLKLKISYRPNDTAATPAK